MKASKISRVLEVIGVIGAAVFIVGGFVLEENNYNNMCKELMKENKEVVNQLDTLDPNSAEWNSLYTQTENENPQLIECIYPPDSNN